TSANEAINWLKLNYTDKKTDYPKSFAAHYALTILHNNVGLVEILTIIRKVGKLCKFSNQDIYNISKIQEQREYHHAANIAKIEARNQACAQKIINQKACLRSSTVWQIVQQSLETMQFHPSFAIKISNFKTIIKYANTNQVYQNKDEDKPDSKNRMLDVIVSKVFNFTEFRPKQRESLDSFTAGNDTLCILPTSGEKTFIYTSSVLLFTELTVVFTLLKALMGDQVVNIVIANYYISNMLNFLGLKQQELVNMGIPSAMLYVFSEQSPNIQEVIFSEIASGFIRILLVTPEKYIKNLAFSRMLQNISCKQQLQFVIDEAHCINQYVYFLFLFLPILLLTATCSQTNAQMIKDNFGLLDLKVFRSSTISQSEIQLEVLNKPAQKENQTKI
ncbi:5802_t:CDS:2, partial [Gigaspora rosea]